MSWKTAATLSAALVLSGCATMNQVRSDVSTHSQWPAQRKPGTYAFERLPSQRENPEQQQYEDAARRAIEAAGFTPATEGRPADVNVQVGARVTLNAPYPYDSPFWWRGGFMMGRRGMWMGPGFGFHAPVTTYDREVVVLIRDAKTGQALYESRAVSDGVSRSISTLLPALYEAALKDFPNTGVNPRRVVTTVQ